MKKLLLIGVVAVMTACSSSNYVTHQISETPTMKRQVYIFDDYVEIHTRTRMSLEQYNQIVATTVNNRQQ